MKLLRWLAGLALVALLAATSLYLAREKIAAYWVGRDLARHLSELLEADVELHGIHLADGILRVERGTVTGPHLPFEHLAVEDLRALVDWKTWREPSTEPLHLEIASADVVWRDQPPASARPAATTPDLDILVGRLSFRPGQADTWEVKDSSTRILREGGAWSIAARHGEIRATGLPPFTIERASLDFREGLWTIHSFALHDPGQGAVGGSARHDGTGWAGEFYWQDLQTEGLLSGWTAEHFTGRASGDAKLEDGTLRGQMKIEEGRSRAAAPLVRMAGIFAGEDWSELPWRTFRFAFARLDDGRVEFSELVAVSTKGLAVRGEGQYAPDAIGARLELGVQQEGRPWLVAFVPVLFRAESEGYFWTPVNVGGTPHHPTEDLTTRVAAALAAAPAKTAVEAAAQIPGQAVEAAGSLLDHLLNR
jgi:hypothetical protein